MKINRMLAPLLLLLFSTGIYTPIKATTSDLSSQEKEKSSAYTGSSTYRHGSILVPDLTKVDLAALKQGLLKMHKEAIATPYENTYVHNTLIVYWLKKSNLILQKSEINIIIHYTAEQRTVYFFLGAAGAGKSTAIFALQGNQVSRAEKEEESSDEDLNAGLAEDNTKKTGLISKTTVQVKTPKIGHSTKGETVGAIIYYPGDSRKNIAFCDTEGFLGERIGVSEAEKYISAFAPFFALKTNTIGGIALVVSAHDILSRSRFLKSSAHFLHHYFSAAGHTVLRQSILLMITQCNKNKSEVTRQLRKMIQKSYQVCFNTLEQRAHNSDDKNMAALQPFFSMLLEVQVLKGAENEIKNFRLDNKRILFFDPCSTKSIKKAFKKLYSLQELDHRYLCHFDNPLSQYLRGQILEIGDELKKEAAAILKLQQEIKIQALQLKEAESTEALQRLIDQLQNEISALKQENEQQREDDDHICVFDEHHIEKLDPKIIKGGGIVERFLKNVFITNFLGYFEKTFSYSGGEPIYQIAVTYKNAELHHITPKASFVEKHFYIDTRGNTPIRYMTISKSTGIKQDKWELKHVTHYFKDANCRVKMYAKKNELASTHKLIADNVQKIKNKQESIEACAQKQNDVASLKHSYESNTQTLKKLKKHIIQHKTTFYMLNTWARDIFRPDGQNIVLLKSYLSDFASASELPLTIKQQAQNILLPYQLAGCPDVMSSYNSKSDQAVPLPPGQLLIPADGQCLYTTIIMGYLLPVRQVPDKVTARIDQLFGYQPAYYSNKQLYETLKNPTDYFTYLNTDAFGILVTAFMARMQIKKGTWGGPHEIQTIATKLKVSIQEYYPNPNKLTNLVQSDLTTPTGTASDITLHIVRDRVHPAEVRTQTQKASAEDNPHYQHYRLKYKLPFPISVPILPPQQPLIPPVQMLPLDTAAIVHNDERPNSTTNENKSAIKKGQSDPLVDINVDYFWRLVKEQLGGKSLPNLEDKEIILLLGETGVGKSTFINCMLGHEFGWEYEKIKKRKEPSSHFLDDSDDESTQGEKKLVMNESPDAPIARMSDGAKSCTTVPQVYLLPPENLVLVDCPGFGDTKGAAQEILNLLMIRLLVQKAKKVQAIIGMIAYSTFTDGGRGAHFFNLAKQLDCLVKFEECLPNIFWGITRYPEGTQRGAVIDKIEEIKKTKEEVLIEKNGDFWAKVKTLKTNLSDEDEQMRKDNILLKKLLENKDNILLLSPLWKQKKVTKLKKFLTENIPAPINKAYFVFHHPILDVIGIIRAIFSKPEKVKLLNTYKRHKKTLRTKSETVQKIAECKAIIDDEQQLSHYVKNAVTDKEAQLVQAKQKWEHARNEVKVLDKHVNTLIRYRTEHINLRARFLNESKTITYHGFPFDADALEELYEQSKVKKSITHLNPDDGVYKAEFTVAGTFDNWWHDSTTEANVTVKFYVKNDYLQKELRVQKYEEATQKKLIVIEKEDDLALAKKDAEAYLKMQTQQVLPQKIKDLNTEITKLATKLKEEEVFVYFIGEVYPALYPNVDDYFNRFATTYKHNFKLFCRDDSTATYDYTLQNYSDQVSPIYEKGYLDIEEMPTALTKIVKAIPIHAQSDAPLPQLLAMVTYDPTTQHYCKYLFASNGLLAGSLSQQKSHQLNYHLIKSPSSPVLWQALSFLGLQPKLVLVQCVLPKDAPLCLSCGDMAIHLLDQYLLMKEGGCQGQLWPKVPPTTGMLKAFYSPRFSDQQRQKTIDAVGDIFSKKARSQPAQSAHQHDKTTSLPIPPSPLQNQLHMAVQLNFPIATIKVLLIDPQIKINALDSSGKTPLDYATQGSNLYLLLVGHDAKTSQQLMQRTAFVSPLSTDDIAISYHSKADKTAAHKVVAIVPLPLGQLLIPANAQCLYTTIIIGYLLPVRQVPDKVTARIDQLFGIQPAYYFNELHQTLQHPTHYLTYLHSDLFGKLVTAFMARMKIKKGTWGGPQEIQTIATKLKVNIQEYYPTPNSPTNLVRSDLITPHQTNSDITLHIVRDRIHPAEVFPQATRVSAKDNPHYQHYRLKYTLPPSISVPVLPSTQSPILHQMGSPQKSAMQTYLREWFEAAKMGNKTCLEVLYHNYNINVNASNAHGETALMKSAKNGHLSCLKFLLEQGADIHAKDNYKDTALLLSAENEHLHCVKYLLEQGADIHDKNEDGNTVVLLNVYNGHLDGLKYLVEQGADIHASNEDNNTALILSAKYGHIACVKYLVQQDADMTWQGEYSKTALAWATQKGQENIVNYLSNLAKKEQPDQAVLEKWHEAAQKGNRKLLAALYDQYNINVNHKNEENYTALLLSAEKGHLDCLEYLIQQGADIHTKNNYKDTALLLSVENEHLDCVKYLVKQGAHIHDKNEDGNTAVLLSAYNGDLDCLKYFIEQGAHIYDKNEDNNTALILSAQYGHLACVKYLVAQGADLTVKGEDNQTVLVWAIQRSQEDVINYLSNLVKKEQLDKAVLQQWHGAAQKGNRKWLTALYDQYNINVNHKNEENCTGLLLSAKNGHLDCLKYLVEQGADINDENGNYTALLWSASKGHLACVRYLVQQSANIHYRNNYGYTALLWSAQNGHLPCVKYLAQQGANIHDKNQWGNTALILSAQHGYVDCVKYLVEQGADVTFKGEENKTALEWAQEKKDVVDYLSNLSESQDNMVDID